MSSGVEATARWFARRGLARSRMISVGRLLSPDGLSGEIATHGGTAARSQPVGGAVESIGDSVIVRPIWGSACYQLDRAFPAVQGGADRDQLVDCLVVPLPVITPRQRLLLEMSWTESAPILYQPVPFPEVAGWPLVRRCSDRFALMEEFLQRQGIDGSGRTYVDLACNYGWFVAAMQGLGYSARGIELDARAPAIAQAAYGLDPGRIVVGDAVAFLEAQSNRADVLSCFSLAHHFIAAGQRELAERVVRLLGERSELGFFFDMGESHERWLAKRLPGWTPGHIAAWLGELCPDMVVTPLGTDRDARGDYATEYGRTLFSVWHRSEGR